MSFTFIEKNQKTINTCHHDNKSWHILLLYNLTFSNVLGKQIHHALSEEYSTLKGQTLDQRWKWEHPSNFELHTE